MKVKLLLPSFLAFFISFGQNTVGTISISSDVQDGYTLFTNHKKTFLIDNCGRIVNEWTSNFPPGNAVYLLENGNILRAGRTASDDIVFGGQGGVVEQFDWDGNLVWQYFYDTPLYRQHHDVFPMPNGNVLILAATVMSNAEAIQAGRDPNMLSQGELYNEQIIEVTPIGLSDANIVWEWNFKDHFIQDFDPSKDNFGNVSTSPEKLDINFLNGQASNSNWLHVNSIQYYENLDQIVISSRNLSEIYIIDHSTTTAEAASSSGGTYGKGGDFLYRWGNPQAYRQGTEEDAILFGQHYPHFIADGLQDAGKIIVFNNGRDRTPFFSEVMIIDPPQESPGNYSYTINSAYGPEQADYVYSGDSIIGDFYSGIVSSAQRLPNGNILICEGRTGEIFEIDENDTIIWQYVSPVNNNNGAISTQGNTPSPLNITFRAIKYPSDFAGFIGRDLAPGEPIELNPNLAPCENLRLIDLDISYINVYPNPVQNLLNVKSNTIIDKYEITDIMGSTLRASKLITNSINFEGFSSGVYLVNLYSQNKKITKKVVKE